MSRETLFQRVAKETKGKPKSGTWYRNKVRQLTVSGGYDINPNKLILDERVDMSKSKNKQDQNKIMRKSGLYTGKIYMYDYDPKTKKRLPVYDKFPMTYIIAPAEGGFYGINLHYLEHKVSDNSGKRGGRSAFLYILKKKGIAYFPKQFIYHYLVDPQFMSGIFLEIAENEWDIAADFPVENFFTNISGIEVAIPKNIVWDKFSKGGTTDFVTQKRVIKKIF